MLQNREKALSRKAQMQTRRANSTGNVYENDLADIKEMLNNIWQPLLYFQSQLLRLKR